MATIASVIWRKRKCIWGRGNMVLSDLSVFGFHIFVGKSIFLCLVGLFLKIIWMYRLSSSWVQREWTVSQKCAKNIAKPSSRRSFCLSTSLSPCILTPIPWNATREPMSQAVRDSYEKASGSIIASLAILKV